MRPPKNPRIGFRKLKVETVAQALREEYGVILRAARRLNVDRWTLKRFIREKPELQQILQDGDFELADLARGGLVHHLRNKEPWAISMTLKSKGNFTEETKVTHVIKVELPPELKGGNTSTDQP
jgi:hypothetical protein